MRSRVDVSCVLRLCYRLSSSVSRYGQSGLALARPGTVAPPETAPLFLRLTGDGLSLNGQPVAADAAGTAIAALRSEDLARLLLSVDASASAQQLADAILALRQVPRATLSILR